MKPEKYNVVVTHYDGSDGFVNVSSAESLDGITTMVVKDNAGNPTLISHDDYEDSGLLNKGTKERWQGLEREYRKWYAEEHNNEYHVISFKLFPRED